MEHTLGGHTISLNVILLHCSARIVDSFVLFFQKLPLINTTKLEFGNKVSWDYNQTLFFKQISLIIFIVRKQKWASEVEKFNLKLFYERQGNW